MFCSKAGFTRLNGAILSVAVIAVVVFSVSPYRMPVAAANGFTVPIAAGVSGPYSYVVGIWPPDPSVGSLHMAITLTADKRPVTDAEVMVIGRWLNNGTITARETATPFSEPWVYELNIDLTRSGEWTFEIEINSSLGAAVIEAPLEVAGDEEPSGQTDGGQPAAVESQEGEPAPPVQVLEDGGFSWTIVALPIATLALASAAWFYRRQRSSQLSRAGRRRRSADRDQRRRP